MMIFLGITIGAVTKYFLVYKNKRDREYNELFNEYNKLYDKTIDIKEVKDEHIL